MNYRLLGSAFGRNVYLFNYEEDANEGLPPGYSVAAIVLPPQWNSEDLAWMLNALYGALNDWTDFAPASGARSFSFYGERSDDASNLCDALAYAWSQGSDAAYENVMASSHDESSLEAFVENLFSGEILAGEQYADKLQNLIFAASSADDSARIEPVVGDAIARHRFD